MKRLVFLLRDIYHNSILKMIMIATVTVTIRFNFNAFTANGPQDPIFALLLYYRAIAAWCRQLKKRDYVINAM
jgi:hypothetical protein